MCGYVNGPGGPQIDQRLIASLINRDGQMHRYNDRLKVYTVQSRSRTEEDINLLQPDITLPPLLIPCLVLAAHRQMLEPHSA